MITWIEKGRNNCISNSDISIKITSHHKNTDTKQVSITFRNGCEKRITKTGYVMIGYDETRLYFAQAIDGDSGFKLTCSNKSKNKYLKVGNDDLLKFTGNYSLLKDAKSGMNYIQKGENKNGN